MPASLRLKYHVFGGSFVVLNQEIYAEIQHLLLSGQNLERLWAAQIQPLQLLEQLM